MRISKILGQKKLILMALITIAMNAAPHRSLAGLIVACPPLLIPMGFGAAFLVGGFDGSALNSDPSVHPSTTALVILDAQQQASPSFSPLDADLASDLGITPDVMAKYNLALPQINTLFQTIIQDIEQYRVSNPNTSAIDLSKYAAGLWTSLVQPVLDPEVYQALIQVRYAASKIAARQQQQQSQPVQPAQPSQQLPASQSASNPASVQK